jgi:glycosyltransferase involved in cell wall biosynthesis
VAEAAASALRQTYAPADVIIVDDGSTDDTRERLKSFGSPVRYIYQENQGVAAARNRGLAEATGDVIAFLDADDVWHSRKLEIQIECLRRHTEMGLIGTETVDWPSQGFPEFANSTMLPTVIRLDDLVVKNLFVTSSVVVRRSVLDRVGDFDRALHGPEDYDLWLRVAQASVVANLPLPLTGYRNVPGSLGKRAFSMEEGMRIILQKLEAAGVFSGRTMLRRKAWSYLYASCGYMYGAERRHGTALKLLTKSLLLYPCPYRRREVRMPLVRLRLLLASARWLVQESRTTGANIPRPGEPLAASTARNETS